MELLVPTLQLRAILREIQRFAALSKESGFKCGFSHANWQIPLALFAYRFLPESLDFPIYFFQRSP